MLNYKLNNEKEAFCNTPHQVVHELVTKHQVVHELVTKHQKVQLK